MKILFYSFFLLMLSNLAGAVDFSAPVVVKQFKPISTGTATSAVLPKTNSLSPNIVPIITLNDKVKNGEISQHEPCAATRLTPTLLITGAHCLVGGLTHGSRVDAGLFKTEDGVDGLVLSNPRGQNVAKSNAQVFLYRPQFTVQENIPIPFDFALVKLDKRLTFSSATVQRILRQLPLNMFPPSVGEQIRKTQEEQIKKKFNEQSAAYTQFINKKLDEVALLTMHPEGVVDELKGRTLKAFFWPGEQWSTKRPPVEILNEKINEAEGTAPDSSHTMLFRGDKFYPGVSGSAIFDPQRKLVVSLAIGGVGNGLNAGGLIDESVCQWAKSHDSAVKCLVRHDGVVAIEQENPQLSNGVAPQRSVARANRIK